MTSSLPPRSLSNSKGFSLTELLLLLAVLAILAGLSGMALMKWLPQANLNRATRTIVSMCQDAKIQAIKRNRSASITCDDVTETCVSQIVSGDTLRQFDLSALRGGVSLSSGGSTTFTSRGRATASTITVSNNAGQQRNIIIRPSGSIVTE